MPKKSKLIEVTEQNVNLVFQALLEELKSIKEEGFSRDRIMMQLDNFMIVILSAMLVSISVMLDRQLYIAFLGFSIILTSLALQRRLENILWEETNNYEEALRSRLIELISFNGGQDLPNSIVTGIWGRAAYKQKERQGISLLGRFFRTITAAGIIPVYILASVSNIALYTFFRGIQLTLPIEFIVYFVTIVYFAWMVIAYSGHLFEDLFLLRK